MDAMGVVKLFDVIVVLFNMFLAMNLCSVACNDFITGVGWLVLLLSEGQHIWWIALKC